MWFTLQVLLAEEKEQYFTQLLTKKLFLVVSLPLPTSPMPRLLHYPPLCFTLVLKLVPIPIHRKGLLGGHSMMNMYKHIKSLSSSSII
jgi:hypothetical protein